MPRRYAVSGERAKAVMLAHPFELWFAVLAFISGLSLAVTTAPPASVAHALPKWVTLAWGVSLTVGGLLTSVGLLTERWEVERSGLFLLGSACVAYAVTITGYQRVHAAVPACTYLSFAIACAGRFRQHSWLDRVAVLVRSHSGDQ